MRENKIDWSRSLGCVGFKGASGSTYFSPLLDYKEDKKRPCLQRGASLEHEELARSRSSPI